MTLCRFLYNLVGTLPFGLEAQSVIRLTDSRFRGELARAVSAEIRYIRRRSALSRKERLQREPE